MTRLKRLGFSFPSGVTTWVVCAIGLELAGVGVASWRWRAAIGERRELEVRRQHIASGVFGQSLEEAQLERENAEKARETWKRACRVRLASAAPESRSRAFFEIAEWTEHLRTVARDHGVACREEERFGFGSYARQGPAIDRIDRVHRQREAAGALLDALFEARPHAFERLQREDPGEAGRRMPGGREDSDYFAFANEPPLALPADTEAEAFRITFLGHTRALRQWLNHLAGIPGPVVVRDVQIEPVAAAVSEPDAVRCAVTVQVHFQVVARTARSTEAAVPQLAP